MPVIDPFKIVITNYPDGQVEDCVAEKYNPDTSVYDAEYTMWSYKEYKLNEWKSKSEKCKDCIKNRNCEWPWREYPELYWWDEFKPIINKVII